jgi:ribosomal protein L7/L12
MSIFNLDDDRIVRILWANGVKISLKKAFEVANIIYGAHLERVNEVENNTWTVARKEADERVRVAAETNHADGLKIGQRQANYIAEGEHSRRVIAATLWAERRFDANNLTTKIACIKKVRENFPLLGLRDCKDVVNACSGEGYGMRL